MQQRQLRRAGLLARRLQRAVCVVCSAGAQAGQGVGLSAVLCRASAWAQVLLLLCSQALHRGSRLPPFLRTPHTTNLIRL